MWTVTFSSDGGSSVEVVMVSDGQLIAKPENPTKTNYTFLGWYKEASLENIWNFDTDVVTQNITLYAKWRLTLAVKLTEKFKELQDEINIASEILEFDTFEQFPETGEIKKLYIEVTTNRIYRWRDGAYVSLNASQVFSTEPDNPSQNDIWIDS